MPPRKSYSNVKKSYPNSFLKGRCSYESFAPCPIVRKFMSDLARTADSKINVIVRLVCHNRHPLLHGASLGSLGESTCRS